MKNMGFFLEFSQDFAIFVQSRQISPFSEHIREIPIKIHQYLA